MIKKADIKEKILQALSLNSEDKFIEFKDARGGLPGDLWKAISAFSNTAPGGLIVFGVKETNINNKRKLETVGALDLAFLQEKLVSLMEHKIVNHTAYNIETIEINHTTLLVLTIDETAKENKPCYNADIGMHKGAYIRIGNVNRQITEEELRAFLRYTPAYNFDKTLIDEMDITDLSRSKLSTFLIKSEERTHRQFSNEQSFENILHNLGLLSANNEGRLCPTMAGALIFSADQPQKYELLSRYIVRCVHYNGKSSTDEIMDTMDIYGTLDQQVDESMRFILRNIANKAKIVDTKRIETPVFPNLALREAVVNALIHRDYSNVGTYVQIAIFRDRIEISNPGTLPPGVTVENLMMSQFSRNGTIARIMRDLDYMEEFGRGIDLIYAQMQKYNLPEPLFKNSANSFKVTLLGEYYNKLNERQLKFWHILQDKQNLTVSIAHKCYPYLSRATINIDLKNMVGMGLIRQKGMSTSTYYEPTY